MKRLLFSAVVWGAALLPVAVQAQSRGMGFRGSSAPSARVSSGFTSRPASFAARPMGVGRMTPAGVRVVTPQGRVVIAGQRFFNPRRVVFRTFPRFHNNRFFFSTCFNSFGTPFRCGNQFLGNGLGYPLYGAYDPYLNDYSSQPEQQQQPVVVEQDSNSRDLALEVQELSGAIQSLREEARARDERKTSDSRPTRDDGPNATLVFRDGLQLAVKNYAISGDNIWVLDDHATRKIPLAKLDVAATQKINDQNGVEFRVPR